MGIGNLGITEILIIAVVVLLFFGPERIPEISRSLGQAMREFKKGVNEIRREIEDVERTVSDRGRDDRGGREDGSDGPARGRLEPGSWEDSPYRGPEHPSGAGSRREAPGEEAAPGEASDGRDEPGEALGDGSDVDASTGPRTPAGGEGAPGWTSEEDFEDVDGGSGDGGEGPPGDEEGETTTS